jgi:hypothetical protein
MTTPGRTGLFATMFARLRFPQLFGTLLVQFLIDLVVPDFIPFADELLLGGLTALIGLIRRPTGVAGPATPPAAEKPPIKDVTPGR